MIQKKINEIDLNIAILNTWKTTNQTTIFLIKNIPPALWNEKIPGSSRRTIGMVANHIHNARCIWIKMLGKGETVKVPLRVNLLNTNRAATVAALRRSSHAMIKLLSAIIKNEGKLTFKPAWLNFPNDIIHFLSYFAAHEAHHRGQIILSARQLNHPLPKEVTNGVWQWTKRLKEAK